MQTLEHAVLDRAELASDIGQREDRHLDLQEVEGTLVLARTGEHTQRLGREHIGHEDHVRGAARGARHVNELLVQALDAPRQPLVVGKVDARQQAPDVRVAGERACDRRVRPARDVRDEGTVESRHECRPQLLLLYGLALERRREAHLAKDVRATRVHLPGRRARHRVREAARHVHHTLECHAPRKERHGLWRAGAELTVRVRAPSKQGAVARERHREEGAAADVHQFGRAAVLVHDRTHGQRRASETRASQLPKLVRAKGVERRRRQDSRVRPAAADGNHVTLDTGHHSRARELVFTMAQLAGDRAVALLGRMQQPIGAPSHDFVLPRDSYHMEWACCNTIDFGSLYIITIIINVCQFEFACTQDCERERERARSSYQ